ncbi:hypothetical protein BaRGS_00028403 [Batillaria attramentaria]|uniref:Uncharacterized protein n=1 Tax=Batillaria attramentaria TaxID=370345 RepID=A0ABD0K049_9CAEN
MRGQGSNARNIPVTVVSLVGLGPRRRGCVQTIGKGCSNCSKPLRLQMAALRLHQVRCILQRSVRQQQLCHESSTFPSPVIRVTPNPSLFDQKVLITVDGLPSRAKVTLQASVHHSWRREDVVFVSYGHYVAREGGRVDLDKDPSLGGSFTGVEPMGLFWSLAAVPGHPPNIRLMWKDVNKPCDIQLTVFSDHITPDERSVSRAAVEPTPLCTTTASRFIKAADVRRIEIREGRVRGTLFLPPGDGPFPGVIDMFGTAGGIIETRAALLASHGFAALSLAFFRYLDLPPVLDKIQLDYFEEAVEWLSSQTVVRPGGIGIVGVSAGATIATATAWLCPKVKAVVGINGPPFAFITDMYRNGKLLRKARLMDYSLLEQTEYGAIVKQCLSYDTSDLLPVWETSVHLLLLMSDDDQLNDPKWAEHFQTMYPEDKRHLIELVRYPGAGHLLEPPYAPHCYVCLNTGAGLDCVWGGQPKLHAAAQEKAWAKTITFLHTNLP